MSVICGEGEEEHGVYYARSMSLMTQAPSAKFETRTDVAETEIPHIGREKRLRIYTGTSPWRSK
jgi:hypothetical protein